MSTSEIYVPEELKGMKRWLLWKEEFKGKEGDSKHVTKIPIAPWLGNYGAVSAVDERNWTDLETAVEFLKKASIAKGLGFALGGGIVGIDFDGCFSDDGVLKKEVQEIIDEYPCYAELSPSKKGLHILGRGKIPRALKSTEKGIEVYADGRYFTFTGEYLNDGKQEHNELTDIQPMIQEIFGRYDTEKVNIEAILEGVGEGLRNDCGIKLATWYRRAGWSKERTMEEMKKWNLNNNPPLSERELEGTVESAYRRAEPYKYFYTIQPEKASSRIMSADDLARYTDSGNAERFVEMWKDTTKFVKEKGWMVWDGKRWSDGEGEVLQRAMETMKELLGSAETEQEKKFYTLCLNRARLDALIYLAQASREMRAKPEDFDKDPMLFNCMNGVIDLHTGELLEHRVEYMLSKLAEVNYDPNLKTEEACPKWLGFLNTIFEGDEELKRYVQKICGFSLTGLPPDRMLFILHGGGGNGKTTFMNVLKGVVGEYAKEIGVESLLEKEDRGVSNDIADLLGCRLVTATESNENVKLDSGRIKQLTGRERVNARHLYHEFFQFEPIFKLFIYTNHLPRVSDTSKAIWDRLKIIPFNHTFSDNERRDRYEDTLLKEKEGILKWMVEGCLLFQKEGLNEPEAVRKATNEYRSEEDIVQEFIETFCAVGSNCAIKAATLYEKYVEEYATGKEKPIGSRTFYKKLAEKGFQKEKSRDGIVFSGIRLKLPLEMEVEEQKGKKCDGNVTDVTECDGTKKLPSLVSQASCDDVTENRRNTINVKNNIATEHIQNNEMEKVIGNTIIPSHRHNIITEEPEKTEETKEEITGNYKVKALKEIPADSYCGWHLHKEGEVFFVNEEQKDFLKKCGLVDIIKEQVVAQALEDMPPFVDFSGHHWGRGIRKGEIFNIDGATAGLLIKRGVAKAIGSDGI